MLMSILHNLMGNAIESTVVHSEVSNSLIEKETIIKAYKLIRDEIVFTSHRLIFVDKQGITGKKIEILSVPYSSISKFAKESACTFDLDEELKIWLGSEPVPLVYKFKKGTSLDQVYKLLSEVVLKD